MICRLVTVLILLFLSWPGGTVEGHMNCPCVILSGIINWAKRETELFLDLNIEFQKVFMVDYQLICDIMWFFFAECMVI